MKVGTDGVLLGAWANVISKKQVLDIGTGTGLIALMSAQRNLNANITAIELEKEAFLQAQQNCNNSNWSNRLTVQHTSLQEYKSSIKFDCVISNPPFFTDTVKEIENKRKLARHIDSLSFEDLLKNAANLLSEDGEAFFIIPYSQENTFIGIAKKYKLFPFQITRVKGREHTVTKRSLLAFNFNNSTTTKIDELIIEIDRHVYTKSYINLTQDFYLKM